MRQRTKFVDIEASDTDSNESYDSSSTKLGQTNIDSISRQSVAKTTESIISKYQNYQDIQESSEISESLESKETAKTPQSNLLPTKRSPKIISIRISTQNIAKKISEIYSKIKDYVISNNLAPNNSIFSIYCINPNVLYIETFNLSLFKSLNIRFNVVPLVEYVDTLNVYRKLVRIGDVYGIRRGNYKGEDCLIMGVEEDEVKIRVYAKHDKNKTIEYSKSLTSISFSENFIDFLVPKTDLTEKPLESFKIKNFLPFFKNERVLIKRGEFASLVGIIKSVELKTVDEIRSEFLATLDIFVSMNGKYLDKDLKGMEINTEFLEKVFLVGDTVINAMHKDISLNGSGKFTVVSVDRSKKIVLAIKDEEEYKFNYNEIRLADENKNIKNSEKQDLNETIDINAISNIAFKGKGSKNINTINTIRRQGVRQPFDKFKRVRITKGPHKSQTGYIQGTIRGSYKIKMDKNSSAIVIEKGYVQFLDEVVKEEANTGIVEDTPFYSAFSPSISSLNSNYNSNYPSSNYDISGSSKTPNYNFNSNLNSKTPNYNFNNNLNSKTPVYENQNHFSKTPNYSMNSKTPNYNLSNKTPNYNLSNKTPNYNLSNKTPNYNLSSKTPNYNISNKTPNYNLNNITPNYNLSNKTPNYNLNNKTPNYNLNNITPNYNINNKTPNYNLSNKTPNYNLSTKTPNYNLSNKNLVQNDNSSKTPSYTKINSENSQNTKFLVKLVTDGIAEFDSNSPEVLNLNGIVSNIDSVQLMKPERFSFVVVLRGSKIGCTGLVIRIDNDEEVLIKVNSGDSHLVNFKDVGVLVEVPN